MRFLRETRFPRSLPEGQSAKENICGGRVNTKEVTKKKGMRDNFQAILAYCSLASTFAIFSLD